MPITKATASAIAPAAKGDLVVGSATNDAAVLGVGSADQVLTVDSSTTTGLKWATPSAGISWTQKLGGTNVSTNSIEYNGTIYVAGMSGGLLYTSTDAQTWTSRTSGFGSNSINKVHWASSLSLWIAVGANGTITTSPDGITWTARTANMSTNGIYDVYASGSTVVAVGNGGGSTNTGGITYSTDGITWTRKSQTVTIGASYNSVNHNGTNWVVGADASTNNALYASTPSGTWTAVVINSSGTNITQVINDGTRTFFIDSQGQFYYTSSATLGSVSGYSGIITGIAGGYGYYYYYNGIIYAPFMVSAGGGVMHQLAIGTTPSSINASYSSNSGNPVPIPNMHNSSNLIRAMWVGAAGRIIGAHTGIWTSF